MCVLPVPADLLHKANPAINFSLSDVKRLVLYQGAKEHVSMSRGHCAVAVCNTFCILQNAGGQAQKPLHEHDGTFHPRRWQAVVTFDLDADLRSIFSWNTKQLFVYLQAEYETPENKVNEIALWDSIIQQKVPAAGS